MKKILSIVNLIVFILMIYVNYLSGTGKINDVSAGGVSSQYPTLFTPAGFTFSIWGLIYLFNFLFSVRLFWMAITGSNEKDVEKLLKFFIISCMLNISWIYAWHYDMMTISVLLMLGLLITLILLYQSVSKKSYASIGSYLSVYTPISLYLGWITIATVANISVWLNSLMWDGEPFSPYFWASLMVVVAAFINLVILIKKRDIVFALVYIWAAYGISIARTAEISDGSLWVYRSAIAGITIVFFGILYTGYYRLKQFRNSHH